VSHTLPHDRRLAERSKRTVGCLRKRSKSLIERLPAEIMLCLRIVLIALRVDFISASTEQRRGEHLRDRAQ